MQRLETYEALLQKWSKQINLVSKSTLDEVWTRHFLDSAQVFRLFEHDDRRIVDLGAGGGFPGLVLAILALEARPDLVTVLVEADARKSAFLMSVARELNLNATVVTDRIENLAPIQASVVTARALAALDQLCAYAFRHCAPGGKALFLKGAKHEQEVDLARSKWEFDLTIHSSMTHSDAALLEVRNLRPKS